MWCFVQQLAAQRQAYMALALNRANCTGLRSRELLRWGSRTSGFASHSGMLKASTVRAACSHEQTFQAAFPAGLDQR